MRRRDVSTFTHLNRVREDNAEARQNEPRLRHSQASASAMQEIERIREQEKLTGVKRKSTEEILRNDGDAEDVADVRRILDLMPLTVDVNPGQVNTDGRASSSFTSTAASANTSSATRLATAEEIREARWKVMRKVKKKNTILP